MSIAEFIQKDVLQHRLDASGCLVMYDKKGLYRKVCRELSGDTTRVVDTSEGSIESRETALKALSEIGRQEGDLKALLVYVPTAPPQEPEDKQADPFAVYAECGAIFPRDDADDYLSLCLRAKPDYGAEIRQVFEQNQGQPGFAVIDAIGGGADWPQLRAALNVESAREILVALLAPSDAQKTALEQEEGWAQEVRTFLKTTLGLALKTRGKIWRSVADETWRYLLFSEFVFDLPENLPETLVGVPCASEEAQAIVEDVCDRLRDNPKSRPDYIERAQTIENELGLVTQCGPIEDLGVRDTFPFEERTFLRTAINGIVAGDIDKAREVLASRENSVWAATGESQEQWNLVEVGLALIETCDDLERQLSSHSQAQSDLIDFYLTHLREADRLQREFEQAVGQFVDTKHLMHEVIARARTRYRGLVDKVQALFMQHLGSAGWPPEGRLANIDVFDRFVAPSLKEQGRKVAYLMVDALRYELGVALEKQLAEDNPVELHAAYAQLPSITRVGMASLLPGARDGLNLTMEDNTLVPKVGDMAVESVSRRMKGFSQRYGDRFAQMPLKDYVKGKQPVADAVDLLVLRSTEIDSQLENNPEDTLSLIPGTLRSIRSALYKLRGQGFAEAVIVTDHGFFLNAGAESGDVCQKPQGDWPVMEHDRVLFGHGPADAHNQVMTAAKLGMGDDLDQVAMPRSMAPYKAGHLYFHGGASLVEAVVPVLTATLDTGDSGDAHKFQVELHYKNGATRITTFLPMFEVVLTSDDMFSQEEGVELLLEAQDKKGNVVGEARPGPNVNPATGTVSLMPGESRKVALKMDDTFEGKFKVVALDPNTLASHASLSLETDYML